MLSVAEALAKVLEGTPVLGTERVGLLGAVGRVLGEDVRAERDVPGYDNSAMDGYAVRHADLVQAPVRLRVIGTAAAGSPGPAVVPGCAVKIMTGAPVPIGADTVVRLEDTRTEADEVLIEVPPPQGANIRRAGEDVRNGALVLRKGWRIAPADVGLLASIGRTLLLVHQIPRVAIVSTGNELVEADAEPAPGQVVNSNAYTLAAAVAEAGASPVALPVARDTPGEIRDALAAAARCDAILSTGGVSVGEFDYVKEAMETLGLERRFWQVAQKPGKPLMFGTLGGRPCFGLPGNPVSSLVCFYLYVRPALRKMMGHERIHLPTLVATAGEEIRKTPGLTEFVRCRLERTPAGMVALPTGSQSSGVLRSMSEARGLIVGPPEVGRIEPGAAVRVVLLDPSAEVPEPPFAP
jgi:molybdopterin molybdotransferase